MVVGAGASTHRWGNQTDWVGGFSMEMVGTPVAWACLARWIGGITDREQQLGVEQAGRVRVGARTGPGAGPRFGVETAQGCGLGQSHNLLPESWL